MEMEQISDAKLHYKIPDFSELPDDILFDIVSRLPLKFIIRCTFLSKRFKNLVSHPSFSHIYHTKKSSSCFIIFIDSPKPPYLALNLFCHGINKVEIFNVERLLKSVSGVKRISIWGYCKGLFCALTVICGACDLFVINPLLGESIQLPDPVDECRKLIYFSYGLGYCESSNRYKVLSVATEYVRVKKSKIGKTHGKIFSVGTKYVKVKKSKIGKTHGKIFTIGSDQSWRTLEDVDVPYNMKWEWDYKLNNPQPIMVPLHSALHWIVQPVQLGEIIKLEAWGGRMCICAFDMTEEKVRRIQLPREVTAGHFRGQLIALGDKLCLWQKHSWNDVFDLWVMGEYGVQGSWAKQFVLDISTLPSAIQHSSLMPLRISPEGVIVLSNRHKLVVYDMKKEKCFAVINQSEQGSYPIHFIPAFIPLRNLVQPPRIELTRMLNEEKTLFHRYFRFVPFCFSS